MQYEYGAVMAKCGWPEGWGRMLSSISHEDVYTGTDGTYGLETEPHATVLYGLHEQVHKDLVYRVCGGLSKPLEVEILGDSAFENEDYDVLKLDVESPMLRKMNEALKSFPYTNDYDSYKPHMTIAYLKKGKAKKYLNISKHVPDSLKFGTIKFKPPGKESPMKIDI